MNFIKRNIFLTILISIAVVCLFLSIGHYADIFIDIGREIYTPKAILEGKILYKDIFCIYGALPYLINTFFYWLLGAKLSTVYFIGCIASLSLIVLIYKISKLFLGDFVSFSITLFVILTGILSTRIFNFTLPYSFGLLYGLIFCLISIFYLLKFISSKKAGALIISSVFLGFAVSSKYDFFLALIPLIVVVLRVKDKKLILKSFISIFLASIFPFLILFVSGLNFSDMINAFLKIKAFTLTESLKTFYITQGVYYTPRIWLDWGVKIVSFVLLIGIFYLGLFLFEKKSKILKIFSFPLFILGGFFALNLSFGAYLFMTFITLLLFIFIFKRNRFKENIFILFALLISTKTIFGLSHVNYGLYFIPVIFISFFILFKKVSNKKAYFSLLLILLISSVGFGRDNINQLKLCNYKIETTKGTIYTIPPEGKPVYELIQYIDNLPDENPYIMIFPEGQLISFISNKEINSNGYYSSLIPLYAEGFGEDEIIEYYKSNPPDYIIFSNQSMESYKKGEICTTYAFDFCGYVFKNYKKIKEIKEDDYKFYLYKRRLKA